ncbi:DUF192 domain-containing protein [Polyangium mundeleinium]|uniref:DUF192 domain-containing protein n=1 Tax=Polyangium mundeleinium TaxID=2995306 RepID=A0ABT5ELF5_9BACT|nr:DUF192 domain-containing protein [Polyangium mundeleinium]MDC0742680.1 DUF192 domain-containing protein [Polyangium mundeleinium]
MPVTKLFVALSLGFLVVACEPRVEEPVPPPRDARPVPIGQEPEGLENHSAKARCIHPTEDKPKRTLSRTGADPACPPDDLAKPPLLREGKVVFADAKDEAVTVEIAQREHERARGLMYRKQMDEARGMIFVFERREVHQFWMHNTCIPLDMLFVDDDGTIVGIEENAPTMNDSTFSVPCASRYVIEVNAGYCRRHGVRAGQKVRLEGI